jgi:hypothetical protein
MASTDDDVIANWRDRVGTLRKRGRTGAAALAVVTAGEIDVRAGRPAAPERLSAEERARWDKIVLARRPGWFSGAEAILESYVTTVSQIQQIEAALRSTNPGPGDDYQKLARLHRQSVALVVTLATRLRLVPSTRLDRRTPQDGDVPVA